MTSLKFSIWRPLTSRINFQFQFGNARVLIRLECLSVPNFVSISESMAELKLLPILDNERPPFWNSTFGFTFDLVMVIGISFSIGVPNFVLWHNVNFHDGGRQPCCISCRVVVDHPRRVSFVIRLIGFGCVVSEILQFLDFGKLAWRCLLTTRFGWVLGERFPHIMSLIVLTPKSAILIGGPKDVIRAIKREYRPNGSSWARRLKSREWTTWHGPKSKGWKRGSGQGGTKKQGWTTRE